LQSGSRGRLEFRFLGALDEEIIREFSCSSDSPWSRKIDSLIQTDLFDVLVDPAEKVSALGGFLEGQFVAIATFEPDLNDQDKWHLPVMAVHRDFQGQGFGQQMKDRLLEHLEPSIALRCTRWLMSKTWRCWSSTKSFAQQSNGTLPIRNSNFVPFVSTLETMQRQLVPNIDGSRLDSF
jgi:GNAT superfamily N-acetyltransferase